MSVDPELLERRSYTITFSQADRTRLRILCYEYDANGAYVIRQLIRQAYLDIRPNEPDPSPQATPPRPIDHGFGHKDHRDRKGGSKPTRHYKREMANGERDPIADWETGHPALAQRLAGQYVCVTYEGELLDADPSFGALYARQPPRPDVIIGRLAPIAEAATATAESVPTTTEEEEATDVRTADRKAGT